MSYLTKICEKCLGTARVHTDAAQEHLDDPACAGCEWCRDCVGGKVVGLPGAGMSRPGRPAPVPPGGNAPSPAPSPQPPASTVSSSTNRLSQLPQSVPEVTKVSNGHIQSNLASIMNMGKSTSSLTDRPAGPMLTRLAPSEGGPTSPVALPISSPNDAATIALAAIAAQIKQRSAIIDESTIPSSPTTGSKFSLAKESIKEDSAEKANTKPTLPASVTASLAASASRPTSSHGSLHSPTKGGEKKPESPSTTLPSPKAIEKKPDIIQKKPETLEIKPEIKTTPPTIQKPADKPTIVTTEPSPKSNSSPSTASVGGSSASSSSPSTNSTSSDSKKPTKYTDSATRQKIPIDVTSASRTTRRQRQKTGEQELTESTSSDSLGKSANAVSPTASESSSSAPSPERANVGVFTRRLAEKSALGAVLSNPVSAETSAPPSSFPLTTTSPLGVTGSNSQLALSLRAGPKGASVNSLNSNGSLSKSTQSLEGKQIGTATQRLTKRAFKEWYPAFVAGKSSRRQSFGESYDFNQTIGLHSLFGLRDSAETALTRIMWAAKCYEIAKHEVSWEERSAQPETYDSDDDDEDFVMPERSVNAMPEDKVFGITYASDVLNDNKVAAGSKTQLIDALIFPLQQDNQYAEAFLSTYRFFSSAQTILTSLLGWYNVITPNHSLAANSTFKKARKAIQQRVIKVLIIWVRRHWHDFETFPQVARQLMKFVDHLNAVSFSDGQKLGVTIRDQRLNWYTMQYIPPYCNNYPDPKSFDVSKPWVISMEKDLFAQNLTLIEHFILQHVHPDTYMSVLKDGVPRRGAGWSSALKPLLAVVSWFRLLSKYTTTAVLMAEKPKEKAKAIEKLIKVAKECRQLNNFNSVFAIIQGLKRAAVIRQQQGWEAVATKHLDTFRQLDALTDPSNRFGNYWAEFKSKDVPAIPFFAAYMHDLQELHDEPTPLNKMSVIAESIDFTRFQEIYSVIAEVEGARCCLYREKIHMENDYTGSLLNHMRDITFSDEDIVSRIPLTPVSPENSPGRGSIVNKKGRAATPSLQPSPSGNSQDTTNKTEWGGISAQ
ncbi:hypothetical protein SmJEL517_g00610 [Synchytrium microbalum]|uniref:Ras-GEF domain-containing protein n=1 Tax=Synchytrium microbalum TaxID=1806994 RepID=A0A507CEE6_9FUNG|nr:uncharacterized protein SmJEL517_g00610 [Synchytrium microbalum]TPX37549.1 hypothetical protein SmJEL517_g00610 [Synchytrium microbalum]